MDAIGTRKGIVAEAIAFDEKATGPEASRSPTIWSISLDAETRRQVSEAKDAMERALAIKVTQGADSPMTTGAALALENTAYVGANYADAVRLDDRARQIQERALGPEHYVLAER